MNKKLLTFALIPLLALTGCDKPVNLDDALNEMQAGKLPEGAKELNASQVIDELENMTATEYFDAFSAEISGAHFSFDYLDNYYGETVSYGFKMKDVSAYVAAKGLTSATSGDQLEAAANLKASFEVYGMENVDSESEMTQTMLNGKTIETSAYLKDSNFYMSGNEDFMSLSGDYSFEGKVYLPVPFDNLVEEGLLSFPILTEENINNLIELLQNSGSTEGGMGSIEGEMGSIEDLFGELPNLPIAPEKLNELTIKLMDEYFDFTKIDSTYFISFNINSDNLDTKLMNTMDYLYEYGLLEYLLELDQQINKNEYEQIKKQLRLSFAQIASMVNDLSFTIAFDTEVGLRKMMFNADISIGDMTSYNIISIKAGYTLEYKYGNEVQITFPSFEDYEEVQFEDAE